MKVPFIEINEGVGPAYACRAVASQINRRRNGNLRVIPRQALTCRPLGWSGRSGGDWLGYVVLAWGWHQARWDVQACYADLVAAAFLGLVEGRVCRVLGRGHVRAVVGDHGHAD